MSNSQTENTSRVVKTKSKIVGEEEGEGLLRKMISTRSGSKRQIPQRRIKTQPVDAQRKLIGPKRKSQLERTLLPDAPPRKRARKSSPVRVPCIMEDPLKRVSAERRPVKSEPSTSHHPVERPSVEPVEMVLEEYWVDKIDIGSEVILSESPSTLCVNDSEYTIQTWLNETFDSDDNYEFDNNDDSACILPIFYRDAAAEPACVTDLTLFQVQVLQAEDKASDRALRDIAPDNNYTFNWSKDKNDFHGRRELFTGTSGPTLEVTDQTRPVHIFDKMFDVDFIDLLCTETNRYAVQKIALLQEQNKLSSHSRLNRWIPTNRDEMITYLSILILQGLYPLPEEEAYFSFNGFGTMPYFSKIMSYNRFLIIKMMLHFVDNQTLQDTTRLCKIRPVTDYFNDKFSSLYMPSQEIAIDESLLKWQGRLSFAQKISSKAAGVGVKTYELCESFSGYLWKFFVYAGKDKSTATADDGRVGRQEEDQDTDRSDNDETNDRPDVVTTGNSEDRPTNATAKIVYDLIEPLLHRGHTLIMDNFYNSPLLLRSLKKQGTDCYGTLRLNREHVPDSVRDMTKTELRQGEVVTTYCSDLSIMVWRDANIVSMISTYHNLEIGTKSKYNRITYKPSIVLDYNKSMGGVDRKDQFLSAQPMERLRNRCWYKKLFRRLYNAAIFNCFVIFSSFHRKISHRRFRTELAEELLKRHRLIDLTTESRLLNIRAKTTGQLKKTVLRNPQHRTQARTIVEENHFPIRTGSKNTCCFMCIKKTRTSWKCEECNVNLCIDGCFKAYHKP